MHTLYRSLVKILLHIVSLTYILVDAHQPNLVVLLYGLEEGLVEFQDVLEVNSVALDLGSLELLVELGHDVH